MYHCEMECIPGKMECIPVDCLGCVGETEGSLSISLQNKHYRHYATYVTYTTYGIHIAEIAYFDKGVMD